MSCTSPCASCSSNHYYYPGPGPKPKPKPNPDPNPNQVRLMQLYEATVKGCPLVCVSVLGGGYDFGTAKPLLLDLEAELPQAEM